VLLAVENPARVVGINADGAFEVTVFDDVDEFVPEDQMVDMDVAVLAIADMGDESIDEVEVMVLHRPFDMLIEHLNWLEAVEKPFDWRIKEEQ
jgi:hypothetical protein